MPFKGSQYILASPISAAQIVAPRDRPTSFADQFVSRLACDMHKNSPTAFILPPSFPCPEFCWNHFRFPSLFPQVFFSVSCFRDEIGSDDQQNLTANWEEQMLATGNCQPRTKEGCLCQSGADGGSVASAPSQEGRPTHAGCCLPWPSVPASYPGFCSLLLSPGVCFPVQILKVFWRSRAVHNHGILFYFVEDRPLSTTFRPNGWPNGRSGG